MGAWHHGFQPLEPQEVSGQVQSFDVGLFDPGDGEIETALGHPCRLGVRGQDPFIDPDPEVGHRRRLWGQPTDVTQSHGQFSGSIMGSIERPGRGTQHLTSVGQELAPGRRQFDVSSVADEKLSPKLTFEIADLLGERGAGEVKALGGPAEMQLFGNGDEVSQLPEFHSVDGTADVRW
jgi:hypothetical protein